MHVRRERGDVGKDRRIGNRPPVCVEAAHPARVHVDVFEAVSLQSRGLERIGLRHDVGLCQEIARQSLLAEAAPAEVGVISQAVHLR
jgi:hypothetical protein